MKRISFRTPLLVVASCAILLRAGTEMSSIQKSPPDDENLKSMLRREFMVDHDVDVVTEEWSTWKEAARFKKNANISDERFHAALIDVYREAEATRQAEESASRDTQAWRDAERWMRGAVFWLGACEDVASKAFLLDLASDTSKGGTLRCIALSSYLRIADAEETKNILLRFLVGEDRMDLGGRTSICSYAQTAFMEADAAKRAAILESLYVGLSQEENKCNFHVYDDILSELSSDYAHSHQRLAILEKLIDAPPRCKADEFVMPNLMKKLKELQKTRRTTNINTNLSALKKRDFNQPLPEEERSALETPPDAPDAGGTAQEEQAETRRKGLCPLAAVAGLLAAIALWLGLRKKRGSA